MGRPASGRPLAWQVTLRHSVNGPSPMSEQPYSYGSPPSPEELCAQFLAAAREAVKALAILRRSRAGLTPLPIEPSPELLKIEIALARAAGCLNQAAEALAAATQYRVESPGGASADHRRAMGP